MTTALERLAHIEAAEFAAVNLLGHPDMKPERRPEVVKALGRLRTEKQRILAQDDTLLRKSSTAPAPAAPTGRRAFEAMPHQRGMTMMNNSPQGMRSITVPHNGTVLLEAGDHQGAQFLRQRGFRDLGMVIEDTSKASATDIGRFRTSRLQRLSGLAFAGGRLR